MKTERRSMKLARHEGMTLVFSLVVFLILTLYCSAMLGASMGALESSARLRSVEKTGVSVNAAARLIQSALRDAPNLTCVMEGENWTWKSEDALVQKVLVAALNNKSDSPIEFVWGVESGRPEVKAAFTDVRLSVTAKNRTAAELEACAADGGNMPTIIIRFVHPADGAAPDYAMTMRIAAQEVETDGDGGYVVKFADAFDKLKVMSSLGAS